MKTVKCAPGVEVCTEAVGAVETSEWGPRVHACLLPLQALPAKPRLLIVPPFPLNLAPSLPFSLALALLELRRMAGWEL